MHFSKVAKRDALGACSWQLNSLNQQHPSQIPMKHDLHRTSVRVVCPFRVRRYPYGPKSRTDYCAWSEHLARPRLSWARSADGDAQVPQPNHSWSVSRSAAVPKIASTQSIRGSCCPTGTPELQGMSPPSSRRLRRMAGLPVSLCWQRFPRQQPHLCGQPERAVAVLWGFWNSGTFRVDRRPRWMARLQVSLRRRESVWPNRIYAVNQAGQLLS